ARARRRAGRAPAAPLSAEERARLEKLLGPGQKGGG
ncbi:MAG: hypothetical protein RL477_120, partial [Pseudomonadota bacterium]